MPFNELVKRLHEIYLLKQGDLKKKKENENQ